MKSGHCISEPPLRSTLLRETRMRTSREETEFRWVGPSPPPTLGCLAFGHSVNHPMKHSPLRSTNTLQHKSLRAGEHGRFRGPHPLRALLHKPGVQPRNLHPQHGPQGIPKQQIHGPHFKKLLFSLQQVTKTLSHTLRQKSKLNLKPVEVLEKSGKSPHFAHWLSLPPLPENKPSKTQAGMEAESSSL